VYDTDGVAAQVQQDEEWDDWVRQAFKSLDSNHDGVICEDDMRMMSVDLDEVCCWLDYVLLLRLLLLQSISTRPL